MVKQRSVIQKCLQEELLYEYVYFSGAMDRFMYFLGKEQVYLKVTIRVVT